MCLARVVEEKVLEENVEVYKVMELTVYSSHEELQFATPFTGVKLSQRINIINKKERLNCSLISEPKQPHYDSGYHCFRDIEPAKILCDFLNVGFIKEKFFIKSYIIPQGTKITVGCEFMITFLVLEFEAKEYTIIVTPVLINPRVPESKTSNNVIEEAEKIINEKEMAEV